MSEDTVESCEEITDTVIGGWTQQQGHKTNNKNKIIKIKQKGKTNSLITRRIRMYSVSMTFTASMQYIFKHSYIQACATDRYHTVRLHDVTDK